MERIESASATYPRILPSSRVAIVIALTLLTVVSAAAQAPATDRHPYGLDPYKPSDAALLRDYGGTLVAQTPLLDLRNLDPYKPSQAALRREIGGALPLWGIAWYPGPMPASLTPFPTEDRTPRPAARGRWQGNYQRDAFDVAAPAVVAPPPASSIATLRRPQNNDGVWITFEDQKWISAGHTVAFEESKFVRVGEYANFPVFRRTGATESVIYVPTGEGVIAPYRLKP